MLIYTKKIKCRPGRVKVWQKKEVEKIERGGLDDMTTFACLDYSGSSVEDALEGGIGDEFGRLPMSHIW